MTRRPSTALTGAAATLTGLIGLFLLAVHSGIGHHLDAAALGGFVGLQRPDVTPVAVDVSSLADELPFALAGLALACVALARRRPRLALMVPVVLVLANVTTQLLKGALAHPRIAAALGTNQLGASFPSGHATAAMSLALCGVLVAPPRLRPFAAAAGALYAIAVAYAILTLGWHYPSDVLGGYLVAATYTLLGIAALQAADARFPERSGRRAALRVGHALAPTAVVAAMAAAFAGSLALMRPDRALTYVEANTSFVAVAGAIALLGAALAAGFAAALRRAR